MKKRLLLLILLAVGLIQLQAQTTIFTAYFDQFVVGQKLVCQDSINWTTWSNEPCGNEDAFIDSTYYSSIARSVKILPNNDLVKVLPNLTGGNYSVVFKLYIPAGKSGYFNVLQLFNGGSSEWGFEAFFNADGSGVINAGGNNAATFNYTQGMWHTVEVEVTMADTNDTGEFYLNGTSVHTWRWSAGATGGGTLEQLGGVNFYGAESTNEMYVDNFQIWDNLGPVSVNDFENYPDVFALYQNYPNPFNPTTRIVYTIPEAGNIYLSVFNAIGEEVAVLTNSYKEAGTYEINFDAKELTSGIYIYKLQNGTNSITKKMLLVK